MNRTTQSPLQPAIDATPDPRLPTVSVVVPTHNRLDLLERCLASVSQQHYPRYEVIVVDDGSTDDTPVRLAELAQVAAHSFHVIRQAQAGPASARNRGIEISASEIVAFIDSDCVASEDWLLSLVECLLDSQAAGVGGPILEPDHSGWVADYMRAVKFFRHRVKDGGVDYLLTNSVAFRRDALNAVGGFGTSPEAGAEDADLSFRLKQAGYRLTVTECGSVVHYGSPASLRGLARTLFRYGRGSAALSSDWRNGRTPLHEFLRHTGAVVLSPFLALRLSRSAGLTKAPSFMVIIAVEHSAFVIGLVSGLIARHAPQVSAGLEGG